MEGVLSQNSHSTMDRSIVLRCNNTVMLYIYSLVRVDAFVRKYTPLIPSIKSFAHSIQPRVLPIPTAPEAAALR